MKAAHTPDLSTYLTQVVQPVIHRAERNEILATVIRTTIAIAGGEPVNRDHLIASAWMAWFMFNQQTERWGTVPWSTEDRQLTRVLHQCAVTLNEAAGPDAAKPLLTEQFQELFRRTFPAVSALALRRLAAEMSFMLDSTPSRIAHVEQKIAQLEAKRQKTRSCRPISSPSHR